MADLFLSFRTDDTPRVRSFYDAFRGRGFSVFWSNDIPTGASRYQAIIIEEIRKASVVVVLWTRASVKSHAVAQECSQAARDNKLIQVVLDEIEPIEFPMEAGYTAQKAMLLGWAGDQRHPEWVKLYNAIDARLGRDAPKLRQELASSRAIVIDVSPNGRSKTRAFVPGNGRTEWFTDHPRGPEMVVVPAGNFMMGSDEHDSERPPHLVTIAKPFAVGRFPITFAEWNAAGLSSLSYKGEHGRQPVFNVSWEDAKAYTAWLSQRSGKTYRLLTEAEWEYCCRAGTMTKYAFGDSISQSQAQFGATATIEVGKFTPNAWGLHEMHGNVWEWCEDVWHDTYNSAPTDGSPWLYDGDDSRRVLRGGSWGSDADGLRSACRYRERANFRYRTFGFRVARTPILIQ
jgi:formylglycine-generating enzyme required for sulfatase activity